MQQDNEMFTVRNGSSRATFGTVLLRANGDERKTANNRGNSSKQDLIEYGTLVGTTEGAAKFVLEPEQFQRRRDSSKGRRKAAEAKATAAEEGQQCCQ